MQVMKQNIGEGMTLAVVPNNRTFNNRQKTASLCRNVIDDLQFINGRLYYDNEICFKTEHIMNVFMAIWRLI